MSAVLDFSSVSVTGAKFTEGGEGSETALFSIGEKNLRQGRLLNARAQSAACVPETYFALYQGRQEIESIAGLRENWDGCGALQVAERTVRNAKAVLAGVMRDSPLPDIFPNPNGTISMEWETERGVANLEIGRSRYSFFLTPTAGPATYAQGDIDDFFERQAGKLIANKLYLDEPSEIRISDFTYSAEHVQSA